MLKLQFIYVVNGDGSKTAKIILKKLMLTITRLLYCVECPQYSTRRRNASNIHRSGMLRKNR